MQPCQRQSSMQERAKEKGLKGEKKEEKKLGDLNAKKT